MPIYEHIQELKTAEQLENRGDIGPCLTCRFWQVQQRRSDSMARNISLCMQPELEKHQLVVSGSSGCNKWKRYADVSDEAEAYMHRGEQMVG